MVAVSSYKRWVKHTIRRLQKQNLLTIFLEEFFKIISYMYFEIVNLQRTAQAMKLLEIYIGDHVASRMAIQRNETIPKLTAITEYKFILRFIRPTAFQRNFLKKIKKYINMYFSRSCIIVRIDCQNMNFVLY